VYGATRAYGDLTECVLYLETAREGVQVGMLTDIGQLMLHEPGHTGGCPDNCCESGCIMYKDSTGHIGDDFCNICLCELRSDEGWGE